MLPSWKRDLKTIVKIWIFNSLFKCKLLADLNLICMYFLSYLPGLSFIFSIVSLILLQGSVYFVNISLFLSLEAKIFISIFFFNVSIYFVNNKLRRIYTINTFIVINNFYCDVPNVINVNIFAQLFVYF